jgi:hypothetical protein
MRTLTSVAALFIFLVGSTIYNIHLFPGMNFDEAWFSLQAHRYIEGQSPSLFGMNTHSGSLPQFYLALLYQVFGASIATYRLGFLAISALALAIIAWQRRSGVWLALALSTPLMFFQLRMGLEVSHFFLLFFAILHSPILAMLEGRALTRSQSLIWIVALFLGVWTHVLFLSLLLAIELWGLFFDERKVISKNTKTLHLSHVALAPLFIQMLWTSKWSIKAAAVLAGLVALSFAWHQYARLSCYRAWPFVKFAIILFGLHCVFNFLVFFDGSWNSLLYTGHRGVPGLLLAAWVGAVIFATFKNGAHSQASRNWAGLSLCLVIVSGWMTVTWAPKSFVLPLVLLAFTVESILKTRPKGALLALPLIVMGLSMQLWSHKIFHHREVVNTGFRFGLLRDSSYDTLPNLEFFRELKNKDLCTDSSCLRIDDSRLVQIFAALGELEGTSIGDAQPNLLAHCNRFGDTQKGLVRLSDSNFCLIDNR